MQAYLKRVPPEAIEECRSNPTRAREYILANQEVTETLCLRESWDGLHYLLSPRRRKRADEWDTAIIWGKIDLLSWAILGKEVLNRNCAFGYGAAKWIDMAEVKDISAQLSQMSWETLEENYDPEKMMACGVFPEEFWAEEEKGRAYLKYWFSQLCKFYERAARRNQAIICYLKD